MKINILIFSIFSFLMSFGIFLFYGASGHKINIENDGTMILLCLMILYFLNGIFLLYFLKHNSILIRKLLSIFLIFVLISYIYFIVEIFKENIGDSAMLIPVFVLFIAIYFCLKIFYYLQSSDFKDF